MTVLLDSQSVVCATVVDGEQPPPPPTQDYSQLIGIVVIMAMMGVIANTIGEQ